MFLLGAIPLYWTMDAVSGQKFIMINVVVFILQIEYLTIPFK